MQNPAGSFACILIKSHRAHRACDGLKFDSSLHLVVIRDIVPSVGGWAVCQGMYRCSVASRWKSCIPDASLGLLPQPLGKADPCTSGPRIRCATVDQQVPNLLQVWQKADRSRSDVLCMQSPTRNLADSKGVRGPRRCPGCLHECLAAKIVGQPPAHVNACWLRVRTRHAGRRGLDVHVVRPRGRTQQCLCVAGIHWLPTIRADMVKVST
mmetsp:Transcript_28516/g.92467  ORF Transcript_28516/g.92467 Transcript_28516/m.92467 type:complete len:210 (-) Transcript_28516:1267-1896(-)